MLVLSRKQGETVCVGDNITVTVLEVRGNHIKVGIDAPHSVRIVRGELPTWSEGPREAAAPAELTCR